MSVSNETPIASSVANGVATSFPYAFTVLQATDLKVQGEAGGAVTVYTPGVHYTVSGVGTSAGSADFLIPPAAGTVITRYRASVFDRSTDYQNNGDLRAATVNRDFDRLWLALQELLAGSSGIPNAVRAPLGEVVSVLPAAALRKGRLLAFDAMAGDPEVSPFTVTQLASAVAAAYSGASGPLDALSFIQVGSGAVTRTAQAKLREVFTFEDFGAVGDGVTPDQVAINTAFQRAVAAGRKIVARPGARYYIGACNVIQTLSHLHVDWAGATLVANAATTTPNAAADAALVYQNWLISTPSAQSRDNILFENLNIEVINNEKVSGLQIGVAGGPANGRIGLRNVYATGGNTPFFVRNASLFVDGLSTYLTGGHALFCRGSSRLFLNNIHVRFAGVTLDYAAWTNVAAIQGWGSAKVTASNIYVHATGGTAVTFAVQDGDVTSSLSISNVLIEAAGQSGLSVSGRIGSSTERISYVALNNIVVRGWICAPDATDHNGIALGSQGGNTAQNYVASNLLVDFCAPWESFDTANHRIQGNPTNPAGVPINGRKAASGLTLGGSPAINFLSPTGGGPSARNVSLSNIQLLHCPRSGIDMTRVVGAQVTGVFAKYCGWDRTGAGAAWGIQSVLTADDSLDVTVADVNVMEHGRGVTGSDFLIPIRANRAINFALNNVVGRNTFVGAVPYVLIAQGDAGGAGTVTVDGVTATPSYRIGRLSAENMETFSGGIRLLIKFQYVVNADVRNEHAIVCTGNRTLTQEPSYVQINAAFATVQTLPPAERSPQKVMRFYNRGAGATSLAPSTGTIDGTGTFAFALASGASAMFAANGTDWMRVG